MSKKVQVLQVGLVNWEDELTTFHKENVDWFYLNPRKLDQNFIKNIIEKNGKVFDAVLCTDYVDINALKRISKGVEAYTLIIDENLKKVVPLELTKLKLPTFMDFRDKDWVIKELSENFFSGQYGDKLPVDSIVIDEEFAGRKVLLGDSYIFLEGDFGGRNKKPILLWQQNLFLRERSKKIWLEFEKEPSVNLSLVVIEHEIGSGEPLGRRIFNEDEFGKGFELQYNPKIETISVALLASGQGRLKVGPLHIRDSRHGYGEFIVGGKKIYDNSNNQEIYYYFNPGDLKPPLNVYFSGYRSAEGFEGFYMMKNSGAPFLLVTDPRLEGGAFYSGSLNLEQQLIDVVKECLKKLNFSNNELVLMGLSMGTFGALYYSKDLQPHSVIVGKPLINLGNVAKNEKLVRPGGFSTSLEVLKFLSGGLSEDHIEYLNKYFWNSFGSETFNNTQFIIAYMMNDDYDATAYEDIINNLSKNKGTKVIGKGILGRHNDNTPEILQWFLKQHKRVLTESFNRK